MVEEVIGYSKEIYIRPTPDGLYVLDTSEIGAIPFIKKITVDLKFPTKIEFGENPIVKREHYITLKKTRGKFEILGDDETMEFTIRDIGPIRGALKD